MSPLPTPINIGNVAESAVGAVNTGVGVVTSVAPEATKVAGEAAPIVADVAQNAGKIDLEKMAMDMAKLKLKEYIERKDHSTALHVGSSSFLNRLAIAILVCTIKVTLKYIKAMLEAHRLLVIIILVMLGILLYLQLSRKMAKVYGWFAYRHELHCGKAWLDGLDRKMDAEQDKSEKTGLTLDSLTTDARVKREIEKKEWELKKSNNKLKALNELFMAQSVPDPDICRAGRLRTDLELYCRRKKLLDHLLHVPKRWVIRLWYYAAWRWCRDWKAHRRDYSDQMEGKT